MISPKETPLLLSEPAIHNKENRLKLVEYLFEKYQIPALFLCKDPVLSSF
jgi:actin-like protein 6A